MNGLFIVSDESDLPQTNLDNDTTLHLLLRRSDMEIMHQKIPVGKQFVWISPADDVLTREFFYIVSGKLDIRISENETRRLSGGDSFYVEGITDSVFLTVIEDLDLVYVSNRPVFDLVSGFNDKLYETLEEINKYDSRTLEHSKNVMSYCAEIYKRLKLTDLTLDDFMFASLFHDVGKCYIPKEILMKPGKLTAEEFTIMKEHPELTRRMLASCFGDRVAEIAGQHHERLDGSGYPCGLYGDNISIYSRIIAVADSFDAMTVRRPYNRVKSFDEAIDELRSLSCHYDPQVVETLAKLVFDGHIKPKAWFS